MSYFHTQSLKTVGVTMPYNVTVFKRQFERFQEVLACIRYVLSLEARITVCINAVKANQVACFCQL